MPFFKLKRYMIEQYNSIEVTGRKFAHATPFDFFQSHNRRLALVFGRNGAGKSTIADAFRKGTKEGGPILDITANLKPEGGGAKLALNGAESTAPCTIHIFDEKFSDKWCRFAGTGLKTIMLMGDAGELHDDIEDLKTRIKRARSDKKARESERDARLDKHGKSPSYRLLKVTELKNRSDLVSNLGTRRQARDMTFRIRLRPHSRRAQARSDMRMKTEIPCLTPRLNFRATEKIRVANSDVPYWKSMMNFMAR